MRPRAARRLATELKLTEEQRERMGEIRERATRENVRTRADLQLARMDLHRLLRAERAEAREVEAQIDRIAELRAAMEKTRVLAMLEARDVLSAEQRRKLRELRDERPFGGRLHRALGPGAPGGWGELPGPEGRDAAAPEAPGGLSGPRWSDEFEEELGPPDGPEVLLEGVDGLLEGPAPLSY
jgi:Spy/CpxP family protein refolding chaperone